MSAERLSLREARGLALAAAGFERTSKKADHDALSRVIATTQLFQIDSVNVLVRAHYLPLFARLGPYEHALLDEAAWGKRRSLFEYLAHEASLVPFALHPLLRWRMRRAEQGVGIWKMVARFGHENARLVDDMLQRIHNEGPKAASDFEKRAAKSGMWSWSNAKRGLEWLFWSGKVTTATRRVFERVYDLSERVIPNEVLALPTPSAHDAHLELTRRAVKALGVASHRDIRDYFRTAIEDTAPCIEQLVEAGELRAVRVEGLKDIHYMSSDTRPAKQRDYRALLAPFDPLVWQRRRTHDLFGFHYRLEIYTPAAKRKHGYYVLPFLLGDRLVARVDLKSDRQNDCLRVIASYGEDHAPPETAEALATELRLLARWLGLSRIVAGQRGSLAKAVAGSLKRVK